MSQTSCDGGKILEKQVVLKKQQVEEYFTAKEVNWEQVSNMTGYEKSIEFLRSKFWQRFTNLQNKCIYKVLNNFRIMFCNVKS